ncbi:MAG: hypothetical protein ACRDYC_02300 [Acidimicrobiales bacterium]
MTPALDLPGSDVVAAAGVAVVVCAVSALLAVWWLRRRWARVRLLLSRRLRRLLTSAGGAGWRWVLSRPLPDRRWRSLQATRRRLLVAVSGSEHALGLARSAGAPLGDLESLSRRLRTSAIAVDTSLRIAQRGTGRPDELTASEHAADLIRAARHIQEAAAAAVVGSMGPATEELVEDATRELAAITAALGSAASDTQTLSGVRIPVGWP